jgi:hypothetical protein
VGQKKINLERAFGSATKRHKRRKEIEQKPQCLAMNPFTQQVKHSRNNSVTSLRCFVLRVPFCGHSTAGFGINPISAAERTEANEANEGQMDAGGSQNDLFASSRQGNPFQLCSLCFLL